MHAIAERNYSRLSQFKPYIIEDGGDIPPNLSKSQLQKIDRLILDSALAIGIEEGIIKGDIVIDNLGNTKIIEIAARLSGGWFATHQVPAASGVNLVETVIRHSLSLPINRSDLRPKLNNATSIRYWFPNEGLIKYFIGYYGSYEEATEFKKEVVREGLIDAFVVGDFNGRIITAQEAISLKDQ